MIKRCKWATNVSDEYVDYHDNYWGNEVHDDYTLFKMLLLESFHTGLSWLIIWNKRIAFELAFDNFDCEKISKYDENKINELMNNKSIIRNRNKIVSTIKNAQVIIEIQKEYQSFNNYLWSYVNFEVKYNKDDHFVTYDELSIKISDDLRKRGMRYFGKVTCYSYLEAIGVYNNHSLDCFKHKKDN